MTSIISQCVLCKHLRPGEYSCKAFPTGIPENVLLNQTDHRRPVEGDKGVRWSPTSVDTQHPNGPVPEG